MQQEILDTIPHRPPFLFVDDIVELRENGAVCARTFRPDDFFYTGHYPKNPITPGVILCEAVFQTAAIFLVKKLRENGTDTSQKTPVLCRVEEAKFRAMVLPNDTVQIEVVMGEKLADFYFMSGKILKNGKTVLTIKYALALVDKTE